MLLLVTLLVLAPQDVDGLRPGEQATPIAAVDSQSFESIERGRLLHALTGAPLAGATIELWVEDWRTPQAPVARGTSRADGSFAIPHPGVQHIDKFVVRAAGFRSTTVGSSGAPELLLWPATKQLGLRVVDLEGKAIAGAQLQTRQTCAHATAAFTATSDAIGRFDLAQFPPLEDEPEMVVSAPGFGALLLQEPEAMLAPGGLEVRLPRRGAVAFQLSDRNGAPLANRRVSMGAEPEWLAGMTDEQGRARFDSVFSRREIYLQVEHQGKGLWAASGLAPNTFEPRLVFAPFDPEAKPKDDAQDERLQARAQDEAGTRLDVPIAVLHKGGCELDGKGEMRASWGQTTLVAGGAFSGWNESVRVLERPAATTLTLTPEPRLAITLPAGFWTLHVQCGDDSITFDAQEPAQSLPVPRGGPLLVCAVGRTQTRGLRLERVDHDTAIDLTPQACIVAQQPAADTVARIRLSPRDGTLQGHLRLPQGRVDPEVSSETTSQTLEFEADPRAALEGVLAAEGRVPRGLDCSVQELLSLGAQPLSLSRRGSLRVRGELLGLAAGGALGEREADGAWLVDELAPGPLLVQVQLASGRALELALALADGEQRELRIRAGR